MEGRAAYAFASFGTPCKLKYNLAMFAAVTSLRKTAPRFPIIAMLAGACLDDRVLLSALRILEVQPIEVPIISTVRCRNLNASTERWGTSYTIANVRGPLLDLQHACRRAWRVVRRLGLQRVRHGRCGT
eukprot:2659759-Prymnesium_polylepis.2